MPSTLPVDPQLPGDAAARTGITDPARLVEAALHLLIQQKTARCLADLGGYDPDAMGGPRRKSGTRGT